MKRILIGALVLVVVLGGGLFFWARAAFTGDTVRVALAAQLSKALGQPVKVGSIAAAIYPRLTVNLGDVAIGDPARIQIRTLHVGTDLRALLSRRIEHARLDLSGARIALPLPPFTIASSSTGQGSSGAPVEIGSIDAIVLNDVEIVSGGRTLTGDIEVVPQGSGLTIKKVALLADKAALDISGRITDLTGPVGELAVKAGALDVDQLIAFANDFSSASGMTPAPGAAPAPVKAPGTMHIAMTLAADRATMGALTLDKLAGKATVTSDGLTLDPVSFGVFGGKYAGSLVFGLGAVPDFKVSASVSGIDVASAAAFGGSPGTITGTMSGKLNLAGRGVDAATAMKTAHGTARADVVNGVVKRLGLVHAAVIATSGRSDAPTASGSGSDEPFTRLGTTLTIADGTARTDDLHFESKDVLFDGTGTFRLDGTAVNLQARVQLSDDLSKQAGRDLVRYTQEGGRVTIPATITGAAAAPQVRVDIASMARRAVTNRANEEAQKAIKKGLGSLLKKQ